jgi:hypothetical protein
VSRLTVCIVSDAAMFSHLTPEPSEPSVYIN